MKRVIFVLFVAVMVVLGGAFAAYRWGRGQGTPVASASELPPNSAQPTTRPVEAIERVLIISIDGGRPDLLLRAKMPTIRRLMETTPRAYSGCLMTLTELYLYRDPHGFRPLYFGRLIDAVVFASESGAFH